MIRRRTALTLSAAGLLAAAPLLTACGSAPHPGAAAVVGGERITVSELQREVEDVRRAQRESPQAQQLLAGSSRLGQDTLVRLIQYRIIERAGADNGVGVTRRELQERRTQVERMLGGSGAVEGRFLAANIAPRQIDQELEAGLVRAKLEQKLGPARTTQALVRTSDAMRVDINPRYGAWDPERGTAKAASEPWLRRADVPPAGRPA
ncbi:lipoprotein [Streptomyces mashuensis]|uniref:Lipoprotein n=1 Tax=Streptomyces mashuensis TaxID=33904 RepID=A0A919EFA2_9ACTN|nr:SurA N-terminal domain-containing protein [Streptomyces mashuensis]GHF64120.1 lipoprotein [Streptomyces mashuensis]